MSHGEELWERPSSHLEVRIVGLNTLQTLLGRKDRQEFDVFDLVIKSVIGEGHGAWCLPGMPQSTIMVSAAHAVPPVANKGSNRYTWSIGGEGGSFE